MLFFPLSVLLLWLTGIASIAILGGGIYLLWLWFTGLIVGTFYLAVAILSVIWALTGRWMALALQGRTGRDDPHEHRTGAEQKLQQPDGTELHVESYGPPDAPVIVLASGWGIDSTEFYYLKRQLADRFRLITWDPRGLGKSHGPNDNNYSLDRMADDLDRVLKTVGRTPVLLLGHSLGGMIVLTFLRTRGAHPPQHIMGVVLANTTHLDSLRSTTASALMRGLEKPVLRPLLTLTIWLSPLIWVMNWLSYLNGSAQLTAAWSGFAGHQTRGQLNFAARFGTILSPATVARGFLETFEFDEADTLAGIRVPALVITSDKDRVFIPEVSRAMHAAIPGAELLTLAPAGHLSLLEQNEDFCSAVARFHARCETHAKQHSVIAPTD
ncbi:MAG: alpha/beta fold hydrolase [Chloroflexota bacterium]